MRLWARRRTELTARLNHDLLGHFAPPLNSPEDALAKSQGQLSRTLPESTEEEYRRFFSAFGLRPDARFVTAATKLRGAKDMPVVAVSAEGWEIRFSDYLLEVSRTPSFAEFTQALLSVKEGVPAPPVGAELAQMPKAKALAESPSIWLQSPEEAIKALGKAGLLPLPRARALISIDELYLLNRRYDYSIL